MIQNCQIAHPNLKETPEQPETNSQNIVAKAQIVSHNEVSSSKQVQSRRWDFREGKGIFLKLICLRFEGR